MSKKSNIPDNIQKQFEKPQFKIGDPVFFTWLGSKNMVMLQHLKQWVGAFNIRLKKIMFGILAVLKLKRIRQRIQQDISVTTKLDLLEETNSLNASKPDTQALIQSFLSTPEGQKYKAEASLQLANAYLQRVLKELNQPDLTLREKMLFNLALMEILRELEKNEEILNSIQQFNDNEIS